jgi:hypothetical protein
MFRLMITLKQPVKVQQLSCQPLNGNSVRISKRAPKKIKQKYEYPKRESWRRRRFQFRLWHVATQQVSTPETPPLMNAISEKNSGNAKETAISHDDIPEATAPTTANPSTTRSGRTIRQPTRLIEVMDATLTAEDNIDFDVNAEHPLLFAFAASADPDTMYLHEAMRQTDRLQFIEAMKREVEDHSNNGNWQIVHRSNIPKNYQILPSVWSMKRKRRIAIVNGYSARVKYRRIINTFKQVRYDSIS